MDIILLATRETCQPHIFDQTLLKPRENMENHDHVVAPVIQTGFSNSAVDRQFLTPVAAAVDGNLSKVMEKNV